MTAPLTPPLAEREDTRHTAHGQSRVDPYAWLRRRDDPRVTAYLEAENDYTDSVMRDTEPLQAELYREMVARIKETDRSVPWRKGPYFYYSRTVKGLDYSIVCRRRGTMDAPEQVVLDQNELAKGLDYFSLGILRVSPDHNLVAYSVDSSGSERYTLLVKDLRTGRLVGRAILDTYYSVEWGNDNETLFYTRIDQANRPHKLFRHVLGRDPKTDEVLHHEPDERFFVNLSKTRSERYLLMELESQITSEVHLLDASTPRASFSVIAPRSNGIEYRVEHHGDNLFIVTNEDAVNFRLMQAAVAKPGRQDWHEVIGHREDVYLRNIDAFADHLVISQREEGLPVLRVRRISSGEEHRIEHPEATYSTSLANNPEFDTTTLRFAYGSPVTPHSVFDYDMNARTRELLKQTEVFGYQAERYVTRRLMATSRDGTRVPISLVHRRGIELDGSNPLLLTGYGSYGAPNDVGFSSARVSLVDRGVIFAVAHVRGGGEMGRRWYEQGKFLHKKNTFDDFIACAEHLITQRYTNAEQLAITGGSAGGLLMGAATNMRPDLFAVVVADVPFVDVVSTMLDDSLPLTAIEWEEWGNPQDKKFYDYMLSYSPYDNVEAKPYPHMLVLGGLNDPRVSYWEPAKWTAKLRSLKTDQHTLLLRTNMDSGHGGPSGRYPRFQELAFKYAFILKYLGRSAPN